MNGGDQIIGEIDLLAYADGLLDADPQRKTEVETYLRRRPAEAARVRAYIEQNAQIRAHFEQVLDEPVPPRLRTALEPHVAATRTRRVAQLCIAASLMLAVGAGGWWLGVTMHRPSAEVQAFLREAISVYRLGEQSRPSAPTPIKASQLDGFSQRSVLAIQAPDLSGHGYTVVDRRLKTRGGRYAVQWTYASPQGHRINFVWATRWQEEEIPKLRITEDGKVKIAYWLDRPLIYGVVGQLERDELVALANAVRRSARIIHDAVPTQVDSRVLSGTDARTTRSEDNHRVDPMQRPAGSTIKTGPDFFPWP
jgi:anti-sigma factor RsiW